MPFNLSLSLALSLSLSLFLFSLSPSQLLPEGELLWSGVLRQHGGGERGGARRQDEVCGHPVALLHPAVPLHELPGAPSQVSHLSMLTG